MREQQRGTRAGSELQRRFPVAIALYAGLAAVAWFTMGEGTVMLFGRPVELRWIPVLILATFAFRTCIARQADKIRHGGEQ